MSDCISVRLGLSTSSTTRIIDLDVDIGADAVDYKYVSLCYYCRPWLTLELPVQLRIKSLYQA